jgi:hypothetical protein
MSVPCPRVSDYDANRADEAAGAGTTSRQRPGRLSYSGPRLIRDPACWGWAYSGWAYSGACATGPADEGTAGPSAGTAASDLMSMRQPVSLAASLAFWPSLPIASDSW